MKLCKYGCGNRGIFQLKNGEWICCQSHTQCPINRRKNSSTLKDKWKKTENHPNVGQVPWNKGLTAQSDERIKKMVLKTKKTIKEKGHNWIGRKHNEKSKKMMSETRTQMYMDGWEATSCGRSKRLKYFSAIAGEILVDGKWELGVSKYLDNLKVKWHRNKKRFPYINLEGKVSTYCPDFYVEDWNSYIEVKGYKTELDECKWSQFPKKLLIWTSDILVKNKIINKNGELLESGL